MKQIKMGPLDDEDRVAEGTWRRGGAYACLLSVPRDGQHFDHAIATRGLRWAPGLLHGRIISEDNFCSFYSPTTMNIAASSRTRHILNLPLTRLVSSSPYGRTHVWRRRAPKLPNPVVPQFPQRVTLADDRRSCTGQPLLALHPPDARQHQQSHLESVA